MAPSASEGCAMAFLCWQGGTALRMKAMLWSRGPAQPSLALVVIVMTWEVTSLQSQR